MNKEIKPGATNQVMFFIIMAVFLSAGCCSLFQAHGPAPTVLREDFSRLDPKDFSEKIKQLEEISQNHKSMPVRKRALFYIALAHMHYKNPSPDYSKAISYLDKYIALESDNKDIDEIVAWKSTLTALDSSLREYKKLEGSYERANKNREFLNKKISDLGQVIDNQKKEIESLKETIRKLDAVQQEIEKKKKGIKK
jgi:outer membrane protein assembly factor BamD (BamD/ComL family)